MALQHSEAFNGRTLFEPEPRHKVGPVTRLLGDSDKTRAVLNRLAEQDTTPVAEDIETMQRAKTLKTGAKLLGATLVVGLATGALTSGEGHDFDEQPVVTVQDHPATTISPLEQGTVQTVQPAVNDLHVGS